MREILFRAKAKDDGMWIEGFPDRIYDYGGLVWNMHPVNTNLEITRSIEPKTIGQFIGLADKNGKKIFEGDLIQFHKYRGEPDWVGVVKYEHCLYMAAGTMPLAYEKGIGGDPYFWPFEVQLSGIDKTTIEVIGNIHDNPELLEVQP